MSSTEVVVKIKIPKEMKEEIIKDIDEMIEKRKTKLDKLKRVVGILKDEKKSYKELKVEKYEDCC